MLNSIRQLRNSLASISMAVRASDEYTRSAARAAGKPTIADKATAGIPL
jgi:hypothetical protein